MIFRIFAIALLLLGLVVAAAFFLLENPDRFKRQIAGAIKASSGYEVAIDGELSWRYWPPIAIRVEQVALATPGQSAFVQLDEVLIDIDLIPLIAQQRIVNINEISLKGGRISLLVDKHGIGNWVLPTAAAPGKTSTNQDPDGIALTSTLEQFLARDLNISYVDAQQNLDYDVAIDRLSTSALTTDRPFDISVVATLRDNIENLQVSIASTGQLQYQTSNEVLGFNDLVTTLNLVIDGESFPQINLTSKGQWRPSQQAIVLNQNDIRTSAANISSTGVINLRGSAPRFDGVVNLQTADPALLGRDFDIDLPVSFLQFTADMTLDATLVHMRTIEGGFDDSTFNGSVTYELSPAVAMTAEIRINQLKAVTYLQGTPDNNSGNPAPSGNQSTTSELIPVAMLRDMLLKTIIRIDSLTLANSVLKNVKVEVNNDTEHLDLIANAAGYQGKMVLASDTNLTGDTATTLKINLDRLDIPELINMEGITGTLTANADLSFTGTTQADLERTLAGRSTFTVTKGTLDVRPLKSVARTIDSLRGKASPISEWADIMPFDTMAGNHVFTEGLNSGQVFNATLENISLMALGGIDLTAGTLDYDVSVLLKQTENGKFKVSDQLAGIRWPLSCAGKFTDSPSDLCLGKDGAISDLVADIVKQDLKRRGDKKIEELIKDKVPEEYKDLTTDLLKNLFK